MLALPIAVEAQYTYTTNNGTITITQYTGPGGTVIIPATIAGLPVTGIGIQAFGFSTSVTSVTIPDSVTNIGVGAFTDCPNLNSVLIGNSVTSIGDQAFFYCTSLASVTIPNSVTNIGYEAFYACGGLTSVTIPSSVTSIESGAFAWCTKLTSLTIPNSVTNIGDNAFDSCTSLSVITVDVLNPSYSSLAGVLFNKTQTTLIQCPGAKAGTYAVPNGVTTIGTSALADCYSLTSITIPSSVTNISDSAFGDCARLSAITVNALNPSYSSLAGVLFNKAQTTLIQCPGALPGTYALPNSVTSIAATAFYGCASLTDITADVLNPSYSSLGGILFNKYQTTLIRCPVPKAGTYAVPNGVTNIAAYAFINCASLTNITIPNGVTSIGIVAFAACSGLTSFTIPDSVTSIGSGAFKYCSKLTSVTIGNGVTSIGYQAFELCTSLTGVTIPNSVTTIMDRAFKDCTGLTSVTIPDSVTSIGTLAFGFCTNLTSVYFKGNAPTVGSAALDSNNGTVYYLPGTTGWGATLGGVATVPWNPLIQTSDASFGVRNNQFGFNITGSANIPIVVEACTDLTGSIWTPLHTLTLTNGLFYFSEPVQTNSSGCYYRIRSP
jgi:hypothetical protein